MGKELESGSKVQYHTGDEKWKSGVIHGVRKVDDIEGKPVVLAYLIDTGKDLRVDVYEHNLKNDAYNAEYKKHWRKGLAREDAAARAASAIEKLPDEIVKTVERQPKQVDVRPGWVKPA